MRTEYDDRGEGAPVLLFLPGWCVGRGDFADGDAPTALLLIGTALIVAGTLCIVEREARRTRARG